jgi:hypothetical protein
VAGAPTATAASSAIVLDELDAELYGPSVAATPAVAAAAAAGPATPLLEQPPTKRARIDIEPAAPSVRIFLIVCRSTGTLEVQ